MHSVHGVGTHACAWVIAIGGYMPRFLITLISGEDMTTTYHDIVAIDRRVAILTAVVSVGNPEMWDVVDCEQV